MNVNMNQMCESLGPRAHVSVGLALFSVGNGLGRIIGGPAAGWGRCRLLATGEASGGPYLLT